MTDTTIHPTKNNHIRKREGGTFQCQLPSNAQLYSTLKKHCFTNKPCIACGKKKGGAAKKKAHVHACTHVQPPTQEKKDRKKKGARGGEGGEDATSCENTRKYNKVPTLHLQVVQVLPCITIILTLPRNTQHNRKIRNPATTILRNEGKMLVRGLRERGEQPLKRPIKTTRGGGVERLISRRRARRSLPRENSPFHYNSLSPSPQVYS